MEPGNVRGDHLQLAERRDDELPDQGPGVLLSSSIALVLESWSGRCGRAGRSSGGCSAHIRLESNRARVCDVLNEFGGRHHQKCPPEPSPPSCIFYFLLPAVAAPGFGLAGVLDSVPAAFFLSDLGFLGSRLLLF
jgi:hypothetical protein